MANMEYLTLTVLEYCGELDTFYPQLRKAGKGKNHTQKVIRVDSSDGIKARLYANATIGGLYPKYYVVVTSATAIPLGSTTFCLCITGNHKCIYYDAPTPSVKTVELASKAASPMFTPNEALLVKRIEALEEQVRIMKIQLELKKELEYQNN
jgi:hypothetical protein